MNHLTILINWFGPYTYDDVANIDSGNGLYMLAGKVKYQRRPSVIQYCGITERNFYNRFREHHKIGEINRDLEIWIGSISYPSEHSRNHLETAESLIVFFWQPELNNRKKNNPPQATTVISHWFKTDGTPRINQKKIYKDLPDVISWDGTHWRTGNLSVQPW